MAETEEQDVTGVKAFAKYFRGYLDAIAAIVAGLPLVLTTLLNVIPIFSFHKTLVATTTSVVCFLVIALIYYSRHAYGNWLIRKPRERQIGRVLVLLFSSPYTFFLMFIGSLVAYLAVYDSALDSIRRQPPERIVVEHQRSLEAQDKGAEGPELVKGRDWLAYQKQPVGPPPPIPLIKEAFIVEHAESYDVADRRLLLLTYCLWYVFAVSALMMMGMREYLYHLLQRSDLELILQPPKTSRKKSNINKRGKTKSPPAGSGLTSGVPPGPASMAQGTLTPDDTRER